MVDWLLIDFGLPGGATDPRTCSVHHAWPGRGRPRDSIQSPAPPFPPVAEHEMSVPFPTSTSHPPSTPHPTQNALDILHAHRDEPPFSTGAPALDALCSPRPHAGQATVRLGLRPGSVLELFGPPGAGKTRALLGLAVQARFRAVREGAPGRAQVLVVGESPGGARWEEM